MVTAIALCVNNLSCVCGATPTYELMTEVVEEQASLHDWNLICESSNKTDGSSTHVHACIHIAV